MIVVLKIGISLRIVETLSYKDTRDALSHDWVNFLQQLNFIPILIPNSLENIKNFLENLHLDGIILSGGDNIGDFPVRDKTERKIIEYGIKNNIPVLGVCRGMQLINDYFGGTVKKTDSKQHIAKDHHVFLSGKFNNEFTDQVQVNSFHKNIILKEDLGDKIKDFAKCNEDNTVEGIYHEDLSIIGVMWHPERKQDEFNKKILEKLFNDKKFW